MASKTDRAWTAGLIDGDGCITMTTSGRKQRSHRVVVVVDSTDLEILHELSRLWGGGKLVAKAKSKDHHRQAWSWRMYGADNIINLLTEILPYMKCPTKIARGQMMIDEWKKVTPRNGHYTEETRRAKEDFQQRFRAIGAGRGSSTR